MADRSCNSFIALGAFALIIATEPSYRDPLYDYSLTWIPQIQAGASSTKQTAWDLYSDIALYGVLLLSILISLVGRTERSRACYYALSVSVYVTFNNMLKLSYADPRPFWSSDDVQAFHCSSEYGNPSGHTMIGAGLPLLIALDFIADYVTETAEKARILAGTLAFGASVGYSRLFLGVHGLN